MSGMKIDDDDGGRSRRGRGQGRRYASPPPLVLRSGVGFWELQRGLGLGFGGLVFGFGGLGLGSWDLGLGFRV